jgi:hypothetical protein
MFSSKMFDELFPGTAGHFATTPNWTQTNMFDWYAELLADEMTRAATSFRQPTDMFAKSKIWAKLTEFRTQRGRVMSTKTKQQTNDQAEWKGFLDLRMSDEQLGQLDQWKPKPSEMWDLLDGIILADYRLTLSYNKKTRLASVTIVDNGDRPTRGYALSTADTDGALALKAACFKHYTLLNSDWSGLLGQPQRARRG